MIVDVFSILDRLENLQGTNAKVEFLSKNNTPELRSILDATYNFKRKYFIKKYQTFIGEPHDPSVDGWCLFWETIEALEQRQVTGNAAIERVEQLLKSVSDLERKWYDRVLQRDLRCSIDVSTIKKAGIDIPEFEVQLAKDGKKCKKLNDIINKGIFVSRKLDGYRCVALLHDGEVTLFSRNGTVYQNFPTIEKSMMQLYTYLGMTSTWIFDGEIMSSDFNSMQKSAFASVRGTTVGEAIYNVFDMIPSDEWFSDEFKTPASKRYSLMEAVLGGGTAMCNITNVKIVEHILTSSKDEALEMEKQFIEEGFEGAMLNPDIPYYRGKVSNKMLKLKTMLDQDCEVIGMIEGNGKYVGSLGCLQVKQENGQFCEVGSGFSDEERLAIWNDPDKSVIGRIAQTKYQELTPDGIMRFPVFIRWRDTGPGTGKK